LFVEAVDAFKCAETDDSFRLSAEFLKLPGGIADLFFVGSYH
jgi:hypothetical protein